MKLLTVSCCEATPLQLQAGKVTASSDAMPPNRNCSAEFQKFMVSLRIIQIGPGFRAFWRTISNLFRFQRVHDGGLVSQIHSAFITSSLPPREHSPATT